MSPSALGFNRSQTAATTTTKNTIKSPLINASRHSKHANDQDCTTLIDLFAKRVSQYPGSAALEDQTEGQFGRRHIKYHELHVASNCFSQRLRQYGVGAGDVVPILGRRSVDMVVAILAILKLRACYVPIDLDSWGLDRIHTTLGMIDGNILVSLDKLARVSPEVEEGYEVIYLDDWSSRKFLDLDSDTNIEATEAQLQDRKSTLTPAADDLAYIIFTSGTTGLPKGVMITQRSITAYVQSGGELPFNTNARFGSRSLLICSVAFDACTAILFSALCNGATIVLADPSTLATAARTCTILVLTPSILSTLDPDEESSVETIFLGGEQASVPLIKAWATRNRRLYNGYGPTEATCGSLMAELKPGYPILLGKSIHFGNCFLVDEDGQEAEEGELYITGLGVGVGYYQNVDLTAKSFVQWNGKRAYRTGDFGRQTKDGIMFLGRSDSFVKNRGFLINLEGDVEPALCSFHKVKSAIALQYKGRLYGIVTPEAAAEGLRDYLNERCSAFIIPDVVLSLDVFPSTTNGKIDRKSLLKVIIAWESQAEAVQLQVDARLSPEEAVRKVFSHVLRVPVNDIDKLSSFRGLGGHSLTAIIVVSTLQKLGFTTTVRDILLLDTVELISRTLRTSELPKSLGKDDFVMRSRKLRDAIPVDILSAIDIEDVAPMTDMQVRLVRTSIEMPGQNFVKVGMTFQHQNAQATELLRESWATVLQRHSIFRTSYLLSVDNGVQLVHRSRNLSWKETLVEEHDWESKCREFEDQETDKLAMFDENSLEGLSHFRVLTVSGNRTRLFWTIHHSLIDGWSMSHILSEVQATCGGQTLEAYPPQFSDASLWIQQAENKNLEAAKAFWSRKLKEFASSSRLLATQSLDPTPSTLQSERNLTVSLKINDLNEFARDLQVTTASVIYSAWAVLLARYAGAEKVVFGAVFAGRNLPIPAVERLAGPLMNSLPFAIKVDESTSTGELLRKVFITLCETFEYQWTSNSLIKEATGMKGTDFYESMVSLQYDFPKISPEWKNISSPAEVTYSEVTEIPLTVIVDQEDGDLALRFMYKRSNFGGMQIERLMRHFVNILETLIKLPPTSSVHDITKRMMSPSETESLLDNSKDLDLPYTGPRNLKDAFENGAGIWSDFVAVQSRTRSVKYAELDELTNRIANKLAGRVGSGDLVCIISDGSVEWILAIIAVIKCGAAYCPVDIHLPVERQRLMINASGCSLALYPSTALIEKSGPFPGVSVLSVDVLLQEPLQVKRPLKRDILPNEIVCLVFTSGSTGTPKGVQLRHDAILSLLEYEPARLFAKPAQSNAQLLSLGFDGCVKEVFAALCYGATLVLKDPEDPLAHLSYIDATMITPTLLSTMDPKDYPNLKVLTLVGEAVPQPLVEKWGHDRVLQNGYGPTECTIICLMTRLQPSRSVSIGRPVPRTACYILDPRMRPCPVGVVGEIYLSGNQVTTGYLSAPVGKPGRFLQDPFRKGWRLYQTGDKGRWTEDGEVEYIGREDDQIKLRGFRIDMGDVEIMIRNVCPEATQAAVVASHGSLIAFVTPLSIDTEILIGKLRATLPHYCQLAHVIALEELPMSPNQKVDRKRLATLPLSNFSISQPLATNTQRVVAGIWEEVLGNKEIQISATDHFFNIGGHSLLQIRVAQQITKLFGVNSSLKLVMRHLVLCELCTALDNVLKNGINQSPALFVASRLTERSEFMPLSHLEEELFVGYQAANGRTAAFNIPFVVRVHGKLDVEAFGHAFDAALMSEDILRSRYHLINGRAFRKISSQTPKLQVTAATSKISEMIKSQIDLPFDLEHDDPVRVLLITEARESTVIVLTMTHLVGDRTTLNILVRNISTCYSTLGNLNGALLENAPDQSHDLTYADWAIWAAAQKPDPSTMAFWRKYLEGIVEKSSIRRLGSFDGSSRFFRLRESLSRRLLKLADDSMVTQHHLVLTAVGLTMQGLFKTNDIIIGAPFANRLEPGTEGLSGVFLDRLPIRLNYTNASPSLEELLRRTRDSSRDAITHFIPYQQLCTLAGHKASNRYSLVEIIVSYHMSDESSYDQLKLGQAKIEPLRAHVGGSKFPLMFEFSESDSSISVDLEYDTCLFTEEFLDSIEGALSLTLELMAAKCNVDTIKKCLFDLPSPEMVPSSDSLPERVDSGANDASRLHKVRSAMAEFLKGQIEAVSPNESVFEMGLSSSDCLMLQHMLKVKGVVVSLRDILVLQTAEKLALKSLQLL